ncbi:conserved hypothetical protein [metagenome]
MHLNITSTSLKTNASMKTDSSKKETNYEVQTIIVEKGTKRIRVRRHPTQKESVRTDKIQKIVCDSCNSEIGSNICKVVLMHNKDGGPQVLHYHFFFPCWDFELLVKKFKNFTLDRVGVSVPEDIIITKTAMIDLKNNFEYWK